MKNIEDVEGECNAHIYMDDKKTITFRCGLIKNHECHHQTVSDRLFLTWERDERDYNEYESCKNCRGGYIPCSRLTGHQGAGSYPCEICSGTGRIISNDSIAKRIARERLVDLSNEIGALKEEQIKAIYNSLYSTALDALKNKK